MGILMIPVRALTDCACSVLKGTLRRTKITCLTSVTAAGNIIAAWANSAAADIFLFGGSAIIRRGMYMCIETANLS